MLWLKIWSIREASNQSAFMGKWPGLLLALSTQRMSYPSRKWGCRVSPRFDLVVFAIGKNQERWEVGGSRYYQHQWPSSSYKKLLDRATFGTVYIPWRAWYKTVEYHAISVGVGRQNRLFLSMCCRNCIIIVSIIVYIVAVMVCQNSQVNGSNKCKHEISDTLHYSIFFILFCHTKLWQIHM